MTTSPSPPTAVLVVAAAGIQRDALVSLLRAQPNLAVFAVTSDLDAVRRCAPTGRVQSIVLDGTLDANAAPALVGWLRQAHPRVRCIVLADSTARCAAFLQAGAHAALLKGCLDEHLLAVLGNESLL